MKNTDTRVQYTKARFHEAMLSLLERQAIGTVTVKALCDAAGLNRGTFYLHYAEPIDVLKEMEWAMYERTMVLAKENGKDAYTQYFRQLDALAKERRLCAAVIGHNGDPTFLKEVHERAFAMLREPLLAKYPHRSEAQIKLQFDFLFSGITGVITAWLNGETDLSDEETANMLTQFCESVQNANQTQGGER